MANFSITDVFVFPEDEGTGATNGDWDDAANFAAMFHALGFENVVIQGLTLTPNYTTPSLDISSGKALMTATSASTVDHGSGTESRSEGVAFVCEVGAETGLSLTDTATNYVYLNVNLTSDDNAEYVINTSGTPPSEPYVKIGEIDTSNDTANPVNRGPSSGIGTSGYVIFKDGSVTKAKNDLGQIEYSNTDSTVVIQNALDATGTSGESVYIKAGNYDVDPQITFQDNQTLLGDGWGTRLNMIPQNLDNLPSDFGVFEPQGTSGDPLRRVRIEGIFIDMNQSQHTGTETVDMEAFNGKYIEDSTIANCFGINTISEAFDMDDTYDCVLFNNYSENCGGYGIHMSLNSGYNQVINNFVENCGFRNGRGGIDQWSSAIGNMYLGNYVFNCNTGIHIRGEEGIVVANRSWSNTNEGLLLEGNNSTAVANILKNNGTNLSNTGTGNSTTGNITI